MENVKLFVVKSKMANGKINTLIFDQGTTPHDAVQKYPILNEREIISATLEDLEVFPYRKSGKKFQVSHTDLVLNENGKIIGEASYSNPSEDDFMEIILKDIAESEGDEDMVSLHEAQISN